MKYSTWTRWFTISVIAVIIIAFIGTLPGSKEFIPYWPSIMQLALINIIISYIVGILSK